MTALVPLTESATPALPASIAAGGENASRRFVEFFAAIIRNPHTRHAYARAVRGFLTWCEEHGVASLAAVQPLHVATWVDMQTRQRAAPSMKQQLAAIRHLFDWMRTARGRCSARSGAARRGSRALPCLRQTLTQ